MSSWGLDLWYLPHLSCFGGAGAWQLSQFNQHWGSEVKLNLAELIFSPFLSSKQYDSKVPFESSQYALQAGKVYFNLGVCCSKDIYV